MRITLKLTPTTRLRYESGFGLVFQTAYKSSVKSRLTSYAGKAINMSQAIGFISTIIFTGLCVGFAITGQADLCIASAVGCIIATRFALYA